MSGVHLGILWLPALLPLLGAGVDKQSKAGPDARVVVGKVTSPAGTLLVRAQGRHTWNAPKPGTAVHAGDELAALPGTQAQVDLKDGAASLTLLGLLPELAASPARESAVRLSQSGQDALDLTLERGRVIVASRKGEVVRVRVKFLKETWDIGLEGTGTQALLERSGSWRSGVQLPKKADPGQQPDTHAFLLLLKGRGDLRVGAEQFALRPLTLYHWNTAGGAVGPLTLKELPGFLSAKKEPGDKAEMMKKGAQRLQELLAKEPVADALAKALEDEDAGLRRAAIYAGAALGDVKLLLAALGDGKHADVRDAAVVALRHWLGQAGGHAPKLYQTLLKTYPAGQAETFLYLLHSFSVVDRGRPETYSTLIDYLDHKELPIRELAGWQLYRLVPRGRDIRYDAAAGREDRARAQAAWRKLIPEGQLPPREKAEP
jgi:hypothetical protein